MPATLIAAGAADARLWAVVGIHGRMIAVSAGFDEPRATALRTVQWGARSSSGAPRARVPFA